MASRPAWTTRSRSVGTVGSPARRRPCSEGRALGESAACAVSGESDRPSASSGAVRKAGRDSDRSRAFRVGGVITALRERQWTAWLDKARAGGEDGPRGNACAAL
ncbi:Uncharacterised protein [Bordetella pertussis]|nr:Uncharacterised protein [Bordetella pertussis]